MTGTIFNAETLLQDTVMDADVCIVGSGAGGGVLAANLVKQGLDVVMLEEGGFHTRKDFTLHERDALPAMYQDGGGRLTTDMAITILQGKTAGGGTAVNWTSCFPIPDRIADHWWRTYGLEGFDSESMRPYYQAVTKRMNIMEWSLQNANPNNQVLIRGCENLGWKVGAMHRNVKGCMNTGYCGLGCPVDAKQSGFVTVLPEAVAGGMRLLTNVAADRFVMEQGRITRVEGRVVLPGESIATGPAITVRAKIFVSSCGAINGPALLLRSGFTSGGKVGRRTFVHPVVVSLGLFEDPILPWAGAPQSAHCHEFIDRGPDKVGYFFEAAPLLPMLASMSFKSVGARHRKFMKELSHASAMLSLCVDGLVPGDEGGVVRVKANGRPTLDYPVGPLFHEAFESSQEQMARIQFAAGAREVLTTHTHPLRMSDVSQISQVHEQSYGGFEHAIFTAHQMGGCLMGANRAQSVVNPELRCWDVENLYVVDGSVLPTSLGVNPSMTIYSLAERVSQGIAAAAV